MVESEHSPGNMSGSLQDQLIKAGLLSKDQAHKNRQKKTKQRKTGAANAEQRQQRAEQAAWDEHKRAKDRELNAQRQKQKQAQEQANWVRQLIRQHAVQKQAAPPDAVAFNFTLGNKIHHLYPSDEQRQNLAAGKLGIVHFDGAYHLLPDAITARLQEKIPNRSWRNDAGSAKPDEDDPYAGYEVPDDLMW